MASSHFRGPRVGGNLPEERNLETLTSLRLHSNVSVPTQLCSLLEFQERGVHQCDLEYGGTGPKFCMFHKRGLQPLPPVEHTKLRSSTSVARFALWTI